MQKSPRKAVKSSWKKTRAKKIEVLFASKTSWGGWSVEETEKNSKNKLTGNKNQRKTRYLEMQKFWSSCESFSTQNCSIFKYNLFPLFIYWFRFPFTGFMILLNFANRKLARFSSFLFLDFLYCFYEPTWKFAYCFSLQV